MKHLYLLLTVALMILSGRGCRDGSNEVPSKKPTSYNAQTSARPAKRSGQSESPGTISRDEAIADIRELSALLESAHPDPYLRGGGKIAFHRRLQTLIKELPTAGIEIERFSTLLKSFVAAIGDGHTTIDDEKPTLDRNNPGGIPLYFDIVENQLYVRAVTDESYRQLIGHTLTSVQSIPFAQLIKRQQRLKAHENRNQLLVSLGTYGSLYYGSTLAELIPEWTIGGKITISLRSPQGEEKVISLAPSKDVTYPLIENRSTLLPPDPVNKWFYYRFIGEENRAVYLAIASMSTFREAFEYWHAKGDTALADWGRRLYAIINDQVPPQNYEEVIRGIPAASETFLSLLKEAKSKNSDTLIVDLTQNNGGLDLMNPILLYYLVGFDRTVSVLAENSAVRKCSPFLASTSTAGLGLEAIAYSKQVPLQNEDYDFSKDPGFDRENLKQSIRAYLSRSFEMMPTFIGEFKSRSNEAIYLPRRIVVLSSATTFSAGFNLLTDLHRLGSTTVGIPSGQAGNSFGDIRSFSLSRSKLRGTVSTKYFEAFADEPEKGKLLPVDIPLTYQDLLAYGFDRYAILRFALDRI